MENVIRIPIKQIPRLEVPVNGVFLEENLNGEKPLHKGRAALPRTGKKSDVSARCRGTKEDYGNAGESKENSPSLEVKPIRQDYSFVFSAKQLIY